VRELSQELLKRSEFWDPASKQRAKEMKKDSIGR
jgi:hypothetical protein